MRSLFILIAILVLSVTVQSSQKKARINLKDILGKDILGNIGERIVDNDQTKNIIDNLGNIFGDVKDAIDNLNVTPTPTSGGDKNQMYKDLVILNAKFFIERSDQLEQAQKTLLIGLLPDLLDANSEEEILQIIRPFLLFGIGTYFNDAYIVFAEEPFLEATKRFLQQYFDSPEAPVFLKNDALLQANILAYVDQVYTSDNVTEAMMQIGNDLSTYFDAATSQQFKDVIQQYVPTLYPLIQNEPTLSNQLTIVYTYVVSQAVELYSSFMMIFTSFMTQNEDTNNLTEVITQIIGAAQNMNLQNVLQQPRFSK